MGPYAAWFNHPMWSEAGFILPLSRGEEAPEAVYLALVEKVRVLRGDPCGPCVLKERSPLARNLKGLESSIWEPSCKEYAVSVDTSYRVGLGGQGQSP
jgi:hypothetical protein